MRALRTPPPGTLKFLFHNTVFLFRVPHCVYLTFGTSLFALQPEGECCFVLSGPVIINECLPCIL